MNEQVDAAPSRLDRRKAQTRAALVDAARRLISQGRSQSATIQEITDTADIGFGSFYNHFDTKDELFRVAALDVLDTWRLMIEGVTQGIEDPAERFITAYRISGRLGWTHPEMAEVIDQFGLDVIDFGSGLAPGAMRDLEAAKDAGRFPIDSIPLVMCVVGGALLGLIRLWRTAPELVTLASVDDLAEQILRMLGLDAAEASRLAHLDLPSVM